MGKGNVFPKAGDTKACQILMRMRRERRSMREQNCRRKVLVGVGTAEHKPSSAGAGTPLSTPTKRQVLSQETSMCLLLRPQSNLARDDGAAVGKELQEPPAGAPVHLHPVGWPPPPDPVPLLTLRLKFSAKTSLPPGHLQG